MKAAVLELTRAGVTVDRASLMAHGPIHHRPWPAESAWLEGGSSLTHAPLNLNTPTLTLDPASSRKKGALVTLSTAPVSLMAAPLRVTHAASWRLSRTIMPDSRDFRRPSRPRPRDARDFPASFALPSA
jgi:hypothetical protein